MRTRNPKKGSEALQPIDDNIKSATSGTSGTQLKEKCVNPITPGKQVKKLKAELEEKDNVISKLTNALNTLNLVNRKIESDPINEVQKTKKKSDGPAPPKTAYKYFTDSMPKQDGVDFRQVWKETTPEVRHIFTKYAEDDKIRYQRELAAHNEEKLALEMFYETKKQDRAMELYDAHLAAKTALEKVEAEKSKGKKSKKDPEAPKRPLSSFMYFSVDKREYVKENNPKASVTDISKIIGEMWNNLKNNKKAKMEKAKYDKMAEKDKARYEKEKIAHDALIEKRNAESKQEERNRLAKDKVEAMKLMQSFQHASDVITAENRKELEKYN